MNLLVTALACTHMIVGVELLQSEDEEMETADNKVFLNIYYLKYRGKKLETKRFAVCNIMKHANQISCNHRIPFFHSIKVIDCHKKRLWDNKILLPDHPRNAIFSSLDQPFLL